MQRRNSIILGAICLALSISSYARSPASADAKIFIRSPQDGATVTNPVVIHFGVRGMEIAPAGEDKPNSGHYHLLIDVDTLPPMDQPIPNDGRHLHFGKGQTETTLQLPPGQHTLQLLMGDYQHIPHKPPVISNKITITVKGAEQGR